jgi:sirohydrochlorin ferrochelatase
VRALARLVAERLPGVAVRVAFADVRQPDVTTVLRQTGPAVVVPAFLAAGYHVRVDIPAQVRASEVDALVTEPLGADLVPVALHRLREAGWRPGDPVALAAAGSADPHALADVRVAAARLAAHTGPVAVGYVATARPALADVVTPRTVVASWLLAPGLFHRRATESGAAAVAAPLAAHPDVADLIVHRYRHAQHHSTATVS